MIVTQLHQSAKAATTATVATDALSGAPTAESAAWHAVSRARAALPAWSERSVANRNAIIERFRALVFEERSAIARTASEETEKPLAESLIADLSIHSV